MFVLFNIIFAMITAALDNALGLADELTGIGPLYQIYALVVLIPGIAVQVRRLHDVGKSGWMILVAFIPIIGFIWLLILYIKDGQPQENKWGMNPKSAAEM